MEQPHAIHHVFVDYENVHEVDHAAIGQQSVRLTLLVGPQQKKLDAELVEQLLQNAGSVHFIRLTSQGRNAVDFALAYYLGRAAAADPAGIFHIISKDVGYDPLIAHLKKNNIEVQRHPDFSRLPFLAPAKAKPTTPATAPTVAAAGVRKASALVVPPLDERTSHALEHLLSHPKSRPAREKTLARHMLALFGNKLTGDDAVSIVATLRQAGFITINDKGGVSYLLSTG